MDSRNVLVRVRPQRIAVLIGEQATRNEFVLAIEFLSRLWGGRYCPIIPIEEAGNSKQVEQQLLAVRPDLVVCISVDYSKWEKIVRECCQPRECAALNQACIDQLYEANSLNLITTHPLMKCEWIKDPNAERTNLVLMDSSEESPLLLLAISSFGIVPDGDVSAYGDDLNATTKELGDDCDVVHYLEACSGMAKKWSWLDFASQGLSRQQSIGGFMLPPTVVVIENEVIDLSLFWNMRMQLGLGASHNIVAFPSQHIGNSSSVKALADWILSTPVNANYCVLRSVTTAKKTLDYLARRLRSRLAGRVDHVDIVGGQYDVPLVVPYEKESYERMFISEGSARIKTVAPSFVNELPPRDSWVCDLVKDADSGRALFELCLPSRRSALEVVNAPFPPRLDIRSSPLFGYGVDSLNVRCDKQLREICIGSPRPEELLEEILVERGITVRKDEKRIRYLRAISMFGGLRKTKQALCGDAFEILEALSCGPLLLEDIKRATRSSKKHHTGGDTMMAMLSKQLPAHARNIWLKRNSEYSQRELSKCASEVDILNHFVDQGVVFRKWKLNRCRLCDNEYWLDNMDIGRPIQCPGCQAVVHLRPQVQLGYALNELIGLNLKEGIVPVVLAMNFLYNTTSKGCIWVPGIKCSDGSTEADFDIFAICDGHIVAAECKSLVGITDDAEKWNEIGDQIERAITLSKKVGVEVFFVAARCDKFPKNFRESLETAAGSDMPVVFLTESDLQEGYKHVSLAHKVSSPLCIDDFVSTSSVGRKRQRRKKGRRVIRF